MEYEEQYIMLDFQDNIEQTFFANPNMFFKMAKLDTLQPFVQISDHVFTGKFEDGFFGTNLFFKEEDQTNNASTYDKKAPVNLKYITKTTKVLSLAWQEVPIEELVDVTKDDLRDVVFKESYETVLNKIQNGSLNIEENLVEKNSKVDIIVTKDIIEEAKKKKKTNQQLAPNSLITPESLKKDPVEEPMEIVTPKRTEYEVLKNIVVHPIREPEYCLKEITDLNNYNDFMILKQLHLKKLDYSNISLSVGQNIEKYVDVKASIEDGIIKMKPVKGLTENDKVALFSLNNFANLSVPMQLTLLVEHLKLEKTHLMSLSKEQSKVKDEFGRTPKRRYRLLKSFVKDLEYYLFVRMKNNKLIIK